MSNYTLQHLWFLEFSTPPTPKEITENRTWRHNHRMAVGTETAQTALHEVLSHWPDACVTKVVYQGKMLIHGEPRTEKP